MNAYVFSPYHKTENAPLLLKKIKNCIEKTVLNHVEERKKDNF